MSSERAATREPEQVLAEVTSATLPQPYITYDPAVCNILHEHPTLLATLQDAQPIIQAYFPNAPVALTLAEDPESFYPAPSRRLVARIHSDLPPSEAVAQLHRFDEAWWLEAARAVGDHLVITLG